jgi:diphthamide biosynthesis protein 7
VRCIGGSGQKSLCRTQPLGGGIWRIKWHPVRDNRVLVAAMHGGCRVLNLHGLGSVLEEGDVKAKCTKKFTEHESMAYGADWLVCPHPTQQNSYFEAAARYVFHHPRTFRGVSGPAPRSLTRTFLSASNQRV